jgi:membrane fusion protein, heavy metal efflux system
MLNLRLFFASLLALCLFFCALPVLASGAAVVLTSVQLKSLGVQTQQMDGAKGTRQGGLPGTVVVPYDQLRLVSAPFAGLVEGIYGAPGIGVKKGQWLVRLSAPQAMELRRDRQQAMAQQQLAAQSLKRDELLFGEGIIPESRLQATRAAAVQADALLAERQDALRVAGLVEVARGIFELRSPLDGVILEQHIQVGQRVEASTLLAKVARLDSLWVDMQVPSGIAAMVKVGQAVEIPSAQVTGRLTAIGRAVDATQSVMLRARIDQGASRLAPGQSVEVVLAGMGQGAGVRLPSSAVIRHQGGQFVFVQIAGDSAKTSFQPVAVIVLGQSGDEVLVRGLESSEVSASALGKQPIVVKGASAIKAILAGVGRE